MCIIGFWSLNTLSTCLLISSCFFFFFLPLQHKVAPLFLCSYLPMSAALLYREVKTFYEQHVKVARLLPPASWRDFWLAASDIISARTWWGGGTEGSSSHSRLQRQQARPNPSHRRAGPHCTERIKFNINEVAHWLALASVLLRNFCRLADFLQYYFWAEQR